MSRQTSDIDRLKQWRLQQDLSYKALAEAIDVSTMALYNVLLGKSQPTERTRYKIHEYLKAQRVSA